MRISVVTPTLNCARYLGQAIASVSAGGHNDVEHIIVDGLSTDGTREILEGTSGIKWVSQADDGQSDAINHGFRLSTGDVLAWQNADDVYENGALATVTRHFMDDPSIDVLYGSYRRIDQSGRTISTVRPPKWSTWAFAHGRFVPMQPATFWRRRVYDSVGELRSNLHYCMDVDFFARATKSFRFVRIPDVLGAFRVHRGSKTQSGKHRSAIRAEYLSVLSGHFHYRPLDFLLFDLIQQRCRVASFVKDHILP